MKKVLIANRGEIAVRIIRACRGLGLKTVAIYSDADLDSQHVSMADQAVRLPGRLAADTYLDVAKVLEAAASSQADAVHPGYGFLSEDSDFAQKVSAAGLKFIGPSHDIMETLGNKIAARQLMEKNDIPMVPGWADALRDGKDAQEAAKKIGYPLILKAAAGGGGRGMRIVRADDELVPALEACQREAKAWFGNGDVFAERYLEEPRHIEIQVLFDEHGHGVHLFERDCSVQRRHQKLLEEAPSAYLSEAQRDTLGKLAVKAASVAGYQNAGTVEFICEAPDRAYFMEVNTRIQVEHPVTEWITGVDLIQAQVKVAMGEPLPFRQEDLAVHGWCLEARINAEDASKDFLPTPGRVTRLKLPSGPFVRVDTHLYEGYEIPDCYDSMVAKLIVWGPTRDEAIGRMKVALQEIEVEGVPTTATFHARLLENKKFIEGDFTTKFLIEEADWFQAPVQPREQAPAALLAAVSALVKAGEPSQPRVEAPGSTWSDAAKPY